MKRTEYRTALKAAREELDVLTGQRDAVEGRIARLRHTVAALEALCDEAPSFEQGLTEACRTVLKAAAQPMTALDVKAQLEALGLPMAKYSNPLASVHTVLKRLAHAGEVMVVYGKGKPDGYQWTRHSSVMASPEMAALWTAAVYARRRQQGEPKRDDED